MSVEGKSVIVTGAAKGIGRWIARTFVEAGSLVTIADIETDRLEQTREELSEFGGDVLAVPTNVRDEVQVQALMGKVIAERGGIDVLVNNAAIVPHLNWGNNFWPRFRDMERGFFDRVIDTALGGTFLCTKHAVPHMEAKRSGHIVNLYGGGGRIGSGSYVIAKEAVRYFTKTVAQEEEEYGVCVVIISPGAAIATEDAPEEARQRMPGPEFAGNRFVLAAQVGMDLSGKCLTLADNGTLVPEFD
jgi:NAD(P)-dependent dehydrogenase (short-subunit alcohol dehydrogenase family)